MMTCQLNMIPTGTNSTMTTNKHNEFAAPTEGIDSLSVRSFECEDEEGEGRAEDTTEVSEALVEEQRRQEEQHMQGIKQEETAVRQSRWLFLVAVCTFAAGVSIAFYVVARKADLHTFELEYEGYVSDIIALLQWEVQYNFALMQQLSATITSVALLTHSNFPNLTDPNFEVTGGYADGMGGIMMAGFAPLVHANERREWETYAYENQWWMEESAILKLAHPGHRDALHGTIQDHEHDRRRRHRNRRNLQQQQQQQQEVQQNATSNLFAPLDFYANAINKQIYRWENGTRVPEEATPADGVSGFDDRVFAPMWQHSPADASAVNVNLLSDQRIVDLFDSMVATNQTVLSPAIPIGDMFDWMFDPVEKVFKTDPHAFILEPVYDRFKKDERDEPPSMVGFLIGLTSYRNLFTRLLPEKAQGIVCVMRDSCGVDITFELRGAQAIFMGYTDSHDPQFDDYMRSTRVELYQTIVDGLCVHDLHIYPSVTFRDSYITNKAALYSSVVVLAFVITLAILLVYDHMVTKRQQKTMQQASRTEKLVSSLFPDNVREQLMQGADETSVAGNDDTASKHKSLLGGKTACAASPTCGDACNKSKPIAEFHPNVTIMFADIVGFTAWSSTREPFQVFLLLETIFSEFDAIAKRRRVFKVETVGDCYVAVCGLPTPNRAHAVIMTRFATDCQYKMKTLTQQLEVTLGPSTTELSFRIGLHSGPVTGGVLRGDNARFQLFGDSMNTAARMESTGLPDRVHISSETAELLVAAGKEHWIQPRADRVNVKGKGELETFWANPLLANNLLLRDHGAGLPPIGCSTEATSVACSVRDLDIGFSNDSLRNVLENTNTMQQQQREHEHVTTLSSRDMRLIDWITKVLMERIAGIVRAREQEEHEQQGNQEPAQEQAPVRGVHRFSHHRRSTKNLHGGDNNNASGGKVEVPQEVSTQLRSHVAAIAACYDKHHPFHNFEHASHVTLSVTKLLARVATLDDDYTERSGDTQEQQRQQLPQQLQLPQQQPQQDEDDITVSPNSIGYTRDITSDPLTQFAVVYSALVHDVDHSGVSNATLIAENSPLAATYQNKSVAENNSIAVAWQLLLQDEFSDLVRYICPTQAELDRLHESLKNIVLATDIVDKQLKEERNARWQKVFCEAAPSVNNKKAVDDINRTKATIVIEHLIQASDVCHTMQHWHIYRKWNTRLFEEQWLAYQNGRCTQNPADNWYESELGFFDHYIIPLGQKLHECGVFGVSSDELLLYAKKNRREWAQKGQEIVEMLKNKYCNHHQTTPRQKQLLKQQHQHSRMPHPYHCQ